MVFSTLWLMDLYIHMCMILTMKWPLDNEIHLSKMKVIISNAIICHLPGVQLHFQNREFLKEKKQQKAIDSQCSDLKSTQI